MTPWSGTREAIQGSVRCTGANVHGEAPPRLGGLISRGGTMKNHRSMPFWGMTAAHPIHGLSRGRRRFAGMDGWRSTLPWFTDRT